MAEDIQESTENTEDKSFIQKTAEFVSQEVKDFKEAGSLGSYVAEKATDLAVSGAEKLGAEKVAQAIDNNRDIIVGTLGTVINTQVAEGLTSLTTSSEKGGLGDRIGDDVTNIVAKGAQALGAEGLAQTIDGNKEVIADKTSQVINRYTDVAVTTLKRELLNQKASLPDNPVAKSQNIRIQKKLDEREVATKEKVNDKKPVRTTVIPQNLPSSYDRAEPSTR